MKRLKNIVASTLLVSSLANMTPVLADNYDDQVQEAEEEAVEHEQAAKSLDHLMNQLTDEVTDTQSALNHLTRDIERNEQFLEDAVIELGNAYEEMKALQDEIVILEENISNRSGQLEEQARKIQVNGTSTTNIDFILNAESLTDVLARIDIVSTIVGTSSKMLEDQLADQEAVIEKTEETERKIVQQNAIAENLEKASADLEAQKISQEALVAQLQIEQTAIGSERDELIAQRNDALQRAAQLEGEREEVRIAVEKAEAERAESATVEQEKPTRPATSSTTPAAGGNSSGQSLADSTTNSKTNSEKEQSTPAPQPVSEDRPEPTPPSAPEPRPEPTPEPKPEPKPDPKPVPEAKPVPVPSGNVLSVADQFLGVPYLYGGTTTNAFDCSGFTRHVFSQVGKSIPRTSGGQYAASTKITNPQPGDLVFFGSGSVTHVGIYQGGGRFIGSQTTTGVASASLATGYWSSRVIGYGRY